MQTIGIIGAGGFAVAHLNAIAHSESLGLCRLLAAVIRLQDREACMQKETELLSKGVRIYRTYEEMYDTEKGKVSLICNPTGTPFHEKLTIDAFRAGYNVLCEKPLTGTFESALRMLDAERASGRVSAVGYQNMCSLSVRRIKEMTLSGKLGRLISAKTCLLWPRSSAYYTRNNWAGKMEVDGTPIYDSPIQNAGAHYLQNMLYIAGDDERSSAWPRYVYGENYRAKDITGADTQYLEVETMNGARIVYTASHSVKANDGPHLELAYEKGRIVWEFPEGATTVFSDKGQEIDNFANEPGGIHEIFFDDILKAFNANRVPTATIANSIQHTLCVDAMFRSSAGSVAIDPSHIEKTEIEPEHLGMSAGTEKACNVVIRDIESAVRASFDRIQSFSAMGIPWARPSKRIDCPASYPTPGGAKA